MQANCHVLARDDGRECLIIDPGMGAAPDVTQIVTDHDLTPVAVLATHGHVDHIADAAPVADHYAIPVWIRSEDRHLLSDPYAGLPPELGMLVKTVLRRDLTEPSRVCLLDHYAALDLAEFAVTITPSPGHTPGSVMFAVEAATPEPIIFTGDTLFAGSIGRTDLPGGDLATMTRTLRGPVWDLPDRARLLPGHGPASTMAVERASNPYLRAALTTQP